MGKSRKLELGNEINKINTPLSSRLEILFPIHENSIFKNKEMATAMEISASDCNDNDDINSAFPLHQQHPMRMYLIGYGLQYGDTISMEMEYAIHCLEIAKKSTR
jgi:hypothetical protein